MSGGKMATLNPKRARFVAEYIVDLNGAQAAIRAGYSPKTARQQADQLLSKLDVREAVAAAQAQKAAEVGRTAQDVLKDIMACTVEAREGGDLKTALKGLELQGKHLGMFVERRELSGPNGGPIAVRPLSAFYGEVASEEDENKREC